MALRKHTQASRLRNSKNMSRVLPKPEIVLPFPHWRDDAEHVLRAVTSAFRRSFQTAFSSPDVAPGVQYTLYDTFTTDRAAGTLNGTVSESPVATGGGVARTVVDTNSKLSTAGGFLTFATGGAASGDPGLWFPSNARVAGATVIGQIITPAVTTGTVGELGWDSAQTGVVLDSVRFISAASLRVDVNGSAIVVGVWEASKTYTVMVVMRTAGMLFLIKGGAFVNFTLLFPSAAGNAAGFPGIASNGTTNVGTADNIRVPNAAAHASAILSACAALAYDSFTRVNGALGSTETTDADSQTIPAKAWTDQIGTWAVATNKATATALAGGVAVATYDAGYTDVYHTVPITRTAGVGGGVVRYVDSSNYIRFSHNGTNFVVEKVVAGTPTTVITAAATYSAGAGGQVMMEGTTVRAFYNNAAVGAVSTISDAVLQTSTLVGVYTTDIGNSFDNVETRARGNAVNYYAPLDLY